MFLGLIYLYINLLIIFIFEKYLHEFMIFASIEEVGLKTKSNYLLDLRLFAKSSFKFDSINITNELEYIFYVG